MRRLECDSLIFDLDGTLWDASEATAKAWTIAAQRLGLDRTLTASQIRSVSGLPFLTCVETLFKAEHNFGRVDFNHLQSQLDQQERIELRAIGGTLYEGVASALRILSERFRLFVVSNCQEWYLEELF